MRTLKAWPIAAACVAAYAMPLPAAAQQPADAPPPPKLEKLEEGEAPAVTIRPRGREPKITEKRAPGGKVTETKVTTGKSTYYLKPNESPGALPGDGQGSTNRGAQWEVKEFNLGREAAPGATAAQAPAAPAPPAPPAKK